MLARRKRGQRMLPHWWCYCWLPFAASLRLLLLRRRRLLRLLLLRRRRLLRLLLRRLG
jgi:hypothetical protein